MRFHSLILAPLAATAGLVLVASSLEFAPDAGTKLTKKVTATNSVKTTELQVLINGEEPEGMPEGEFSYESTDEFVFEDEFAKCADGRATDLKRTFKSLSTKSSQGGGEETTEREKESDLASKTVRFQWDADKEEYKTKFVGDEGDDALLADLDPDLDFLHFLPKKSVKEGDEWEVDGRDAAILMFPGGDLKMHSSEDDESDDQMDKSLREHLGGKLTVTHKGEKSEDGAQLVVLEFKGELTTQGESENEERGRTSLDIHLDVTGEILWDAKAHHVHSAKMHGKDKTHYNVTLEIHHGEESATIEQKLTFEGDATLELELED